MRTWLTETFGLRVPVVNAPMAGVAGGELAAAVSAAGAFGMIGVGARTSPSWICEQAQIAGGARQRFGIGLQAWVLTQRPEQLDVTLDAAPSLISVSYGDYARHIERIHDAGIPVATTVATLAEARAAVDAGIDVLVARGGEGGGHGVNQVATLPLLEAVLEDVVDVPVIAAGGIASFRGLAAVIAAGAAGGWVGTAFLACHEATSTRAAKARLASAGDVDTVYGRVFDIAGRAGWPAEFGQRALRNPFHDHWAGREEELAGDDAAVTEFADASRTEDYAVACLNAGQGVSVLRAEHSAAYVVGQFAEVEQQLRRAAGSAGAGGPAGQGGSAGTGGATSSSEPWA